MRQYLHSNFHFALSHLRNMAVVPSGRTAMIVFALAAMTWFACAASVYGQSGTKSDKEKPEKPDKTKAEHPLELPEFVITGVEALDVPGGAKQSPKLPAKLTTSDLYRFNPLDKISFALLPQTPLPRLSLPAQERSGFLKGEFGMFTTPSIDAGYHAVLGNFDLNANAGATFSNGHLLNADFSDVYGSLKSTYLAPEKFLFFGGSRTDTYLKSRHRAYKFFGARDTLLPVPNRTALTISGGIQTVGAFEGWVYDMGANADFLHLTTEGLRFYFPLMENNLLLNGHILGKKVLGEWAFGGSIDANTQFTGSDLRFAGVILSPTVLTEFRNASKTTELKLQGGILASPSFSRIYPTGRLNAALHLGSGLALFAHAFSGIRFNSLFSLIAQNPYSTAEVFSITSPVGYYVNYFLYDAHLYLRFQPSSQLSFTVGAHSEAHQGAISFVENFIGGIGGANDSTSIHRIFAETALLLDSSNTLTARINANFSSSARFGTVPYLAPLEASLEYRRYWLPALSTTLTGLYIGDRTNGGLRGLSERRILPAFADIRLHVEYHFSPQFSIYARGTNLLNQPIFMWDGYRERGIFAALGAMLTF